MLRLTSTQAALVARLRDSGAARRLCVSTGCGRKPYTGGRVPPYGRREYAAAIKLRDLGVLVFERSTSERHTGAGWTTHHTDHLFTPGPRWAEVTA